MDELEPEPFYVVGGTVPVEAPSYVMRRADEELFVGLVRGEFCYVLTSRQMGKSSLMARTAQRLRETGVVSAVVDLTTIGQDLDREKWYYSLLFEIASPLRMRQEVKAFWASEADLPPLQRWIEVLRTVLRQLGNTRLVIFIDEIDNVLALPFPTGEFFSAIRSCYNRRTENPEFSRLTFCLLGVAHHSDLINDVRLTPFNIGRRIALNDFSREEAEVLEEGMKVDDLVRQAVLDRILHWTGGHPYLTQRLCREIVECRVVISPALVDEQCNRLFLSSSAREQDDNLVFVRDRLLTSENRPNGRVDLLRLYERICKGQPVLDSKADRLVGLLRLSGVVRSVNGHLQVRNRIYARVFDRAWALSQLPGAELRRERAAVRRALWRATGVSSFVILLISSLAIAALLQSWRADKENARANTAVTHLRRSLYTSDMSLVQIAWQSSNLPRAIQLLEDEKLQNDNLRPGQEYLLGWEWRYYWGLCHRDLRTIHAHSKLIFSTAISPNGKILATAGADAVVRLWNLPAWTLRNEIPLQGEVAISVAFSYDGKMLATGETHGGMRLWDVSTGKMKAFQHRTNQKANVEDIAFSPDNRTVASAARDDQGVLIWNITAQNQILANPVASLAIIPCGHLAFSPDGRLLAVTGLHGTVGLWNPVTRRCQKALRVKTDTRIPLLGIAFSPDGRRLAAGSEQGTLATWDATSGKLIYSFPAHEGLINSVSFSHDGRTIATGAWDYATRLWNAETGRLKATFYGHTDKVTSVVFSKDGKEVISSGGNDVKVWQVNAQEELRVWHMPIYTFLSVAFTPDGRSLSACAASGFATQWDMSSGQKVSERRLARETSNSLAYSPDGTTLAIADPFPASAVRFWNLQNDIAPRELVSFPQNDLYSVAISPDGSLLATTNGNPGKINIWDARTHQLQATLHGHSGFVRGIAFLPDGKSLATGGWEGDVRIWDVRSHREISQFQAHSKGVNCLAVSPDGRTLATGGNEGRIILWNLATQREMVSFDVAKVVNSIAFSRDSRQLAASSDAGRTLRIWAVVGLQQY